MTRRWSYAHPLIILRPSPIHGTGGFARVDIRRGKRLIEYIGPRISKAESQVQLEQQNAYIFILDDDYDIDGSVPWNLARFLNHSCAPNCEAETVRGRIWIRSCRTIKAGEELTYNYCYTLDGYEHRPCACGAPTCVGYMVAEELFAALRQRTRHPASTPRL
jgi:hypothetical protein